MNRCYSAEEKLCAGRIRAGYFRVVERARLRRVQFFIRGVAWNNNVRVMAEPLHAAVPHIAMNIVISARRPDKKCHMPRGSQREPNYDYVPRKATRTEQFTDSEEVQDTSDRQQNDEGWFACTAKFP